MKLIVGHPGMPDGHIKPDEIMRHNEKRSAKSNENGIRVDFKEASDKKIYLFNITGFVQM